MGETLVSIRNGALRLGYAALLKPLFFAHDPEKTHDRMLKFGVSLGRSHVLRNMTALAFGYRDPRLAQDILGIHFANPIGLAAGFDKDAELTDIIPAVGFGFEEVGSITGEPCEGNARPRLWRLKKSKALVVYYGLKNKGCEELAEKLRDKTFSIPIGTSIAKTNSPDTVGVQAGILDYVKAFTAFRAIGDYFTINISCPNAFGGEPFTDPARLDALLTEIDRIETTKPIFLKISPDLDKDQVDAILKVVASHRVHGFISSNLTKRRANPKIKDACPEFGGISGKVVEDLANDLISYIYRATAGKYVIIGCGGVFGADDAYKKIRLGTSLIQLITGMIFEGPQVVSSINQGLARLLRRDGYTHISEAIGADHREHRAR